MQPDPFVSQVARIEQALSTIRGIGIRVDGACVRGWSLREFGDEARRYLGTGQLLEIGMTYLLIHKGEVMHHFDLCMTKLRLRLRGLGDIPRTQSEP